MLPGKTYTPEDILLIALRRKWWILVPTVLGTIVAFIVGKQMPLHYRSDTVIMLMPQRVSGDYVKAAAGAPLEERLSTLSQQILSRSRLEQIVSAFNLYEKERQALPIEEVVRRMRAEDVALKIESRETFRLSYTGLNPKTVQQVTERLANLFIEKDVRDRENLTDDTNQFLDSELEDAKRRLVEYETKVGEFRRLYSNQLQAAAPFNVQVVQNAQAQLQMLHDAINRDQDRRLFLERQIADIQSGELTAAAVAATTQNPANADTAAHRLEIAQGQLRALQTRLKPDHPDIRAMERTIRDLESAVQAENTGIPEKPAAAETPTAAPVNEALRQRRVRDLRAQMDELDRQIKGKQDQDRQFREVIAEHQANLDAVPRRESEFVELTRDYGTLQNTYGGLLRRQQEFRISASLEKRSLADQFKVLEPARESERPVGPRRIKIYAIGAIGSVFLGLLLAAVLEYLDNSLRSKADVEQVLKLPVLATVPNIFAGAQRAPRPS